MSERVRVRESEGEREREREGEGEGRYRWERDMRRQVASSMHLHANKIHTCVCKTSYVCGLDWWERAEECVCV